MSLTPSRGVNAAALGGAVVLLAACSGLGSASTGVPEEREAANFYLWAKRGADAGDLARAYCVGGSHRERQWFREAFDHHAPPAQVLINCPE